MKKLFLVLVILSFVENAIAQIKMAQFPEKERKEVIFVYDSLTNIKGLGSGEFADRYRHLIGQKITSIASEEYFGPLLQNKIVDGKIYSIDSMSCNKIYMSSGDNPNHKFSLSFSESLAETYNEVWVCHGYFEKVKNLYLGKYLVYVNQDRNFDILGHPLFMDYHTKRNLANNILCNSVWKCTDVLVFPENTPDRIYKDKVILNIENEQFGKYYIFASELIKTKTKQNEWCEYFMSLEDFQHYQSIQNQLLQEAKAKAEAEAAKAAAERARKENERRNKILAKYGERYGNLIIKGRVIIGMTKQQCIDAWGQPQYINRTTTALIVYEQWVYSGKYLYFENDKLTTIQD